MTLAELTPSTLQTLPSSLESGFKELEEINQAVPNDVALDKLPLIIERTLFLGRYIETHLLNVEEKIKQLTGGCPEPKLEQNTNPPTT